jgi:hypothetical protein
MAGKTAANPINLVSINGIPADCAGGFGGGYDWSGGTITRVVHYGATMRERSNQRSVHQRA